MDSSIVQTMVDKLNQTIDERVNGGLGSSVTQALRDIADAVTGAIRELETENELLRDKELIAYCEFTVANEMATPDELEMMRKWLAVARCEQLKHGTHPPLDTPTE